ncbi:hypothetical protein SOW02_21165 [Pectobacterium actinidiae]|uniref:hypothetical protein n=1 Tax=Pectobacterium actinidiae TaxID=1507808 RepID=UPI002A8254FA|nr:hypothetical protein [Pectobacterium actinidiae]MDY4317423.1 hypothetical protein [Pectobacterium actinidiae]
MTSVNQSISTYVHHLEFLRETTCKVMQEMADELGCNKDNESILNAIVHLKQRIEELESRSINLPRLPILGSNAEWYQGFAAGSRSMRNDFIGAINAAGIRIK